MPKYENQLYEDERINFIRTFNHDPEKAIKDFCESEEEKLRPVKMLDESLEEELSQIFDRDQQLAILFHQKNRELNPKLVGEYLCQDKDNSQNTLKYFTEIMDFQGKSITEGLRDYLAKISLSDKIPEIRRITETYGKEYYQQNKDDLKGTKDIANPEAAISLAYQVIITSRNKEKQANKFIDSLKGANGEGHFSPDYLKKLYDDIKNKPLEAKRADVPVQYKLSMVTKNPFDKLAADLKQDNLEESWLGGHKKVQLTKTLDNDQQIGVIVEVSYKHAFGNSCDIIVQPVAPEGKTPSKEALDLAAGII